MALVLGKSACRLVFLGLVGVRFRRGFQRSLASAHGTRVGQVCLSPRVSWFGWRALSSWLSALALGKSACRLVFLGLVGVRFRRGFQRSLASALGTRVGQVCLSPHVS